MSTVGVYIGRFQPFHNGHKSVVDRMLAENDRVCIAVGSDNSRSTNNPFSYSERIQLIDSAYRTSSKPPSYVKIVDVPEDDDAWAAKVKQRVGHSNPNIDVVRLYGAYSDASSFYLDLFPEWEKRLTKLSGYHVHATTIRLWLRNRDWTHIQQNVPPGTFEYLKQLVENEPDTCHKWLRSIQ